MKIAFASASGTTFQVPTRFHFSALGLCCCLLLAQHQGAHALPILLSQIPPGNGGREPAPNVIISVDDSNSMLWDVNTDNNTSNVANRKITLLKNALKSQFGNGTPNSGRIPDGRIRLAWQAMHDAGNSIPGNGASSIKLGAKNSMKLFTGQHRVHFNDFVDSLTNGGGTPSHTMMENVYTYMHAPENVDSPWADTPGTAQSTPYLACRRSYHIFMTDGAWNSQSDTQRVANGDYTSRFLGDGVNYYDKDSDQTKVYSDPYGENDTAHASTLSDFAFRNWAADLQDGGRGSTQNNSAGTQISGNTQNMPNGANGVKPLIKASGVEKVWVGSGAAPAACNAASKCTPLQEFWNPKNDPASWQHLTQYTIGFGLGAINWPYGPPPVNDGDQNAAGRTGPADWSYNNPANDNYGGDYPRLVNGGLTAPDGLRWPNVKTNNAGGGVDIRTVELWHMALNGRGRYYPAASAAALTQAFADILDNIQADTNRPLVSIAASSSKLSDNSNVYIAGYDGATWGGTLSAFPINPTTAVLTTTPAWRAAAKLDALTTVSNRFVLSYNGSTGIVWKTYSALPSAQQLPLNKNSAGNVDNKGQERVDYIRGDRSNEAGNGGVFRTRDSRMGDIVNANIWYTGKPASGYTRDNYAAFRSISTGMGGRTPMLYVGANDGMLHGFAAADWPTAPAARTIEGGQEVLAYIPQGIAQGDLRKLTDPNYLHQYFVDGSPFTGDAYLGAPAAWKTVLVGSLGAGGKGYFILDVTNPALFNQANAGNLVLTDTTASTDADVGHIMSPPAVGIGEPYNKSDQIVKMNNGRWAVVLGNGYNSTNEAPVLLIQYLDGTKGVVKVSPCTLPISTSACVFKGGNGLSTPRLIDLDGNGTVDVAYAGDLQGNLWKFNLTSANDTQWVTAFAGQPFFVAKPNGQKAITTAPFWASHPQGGIMLAIGTGRNLSDADRSTTGTDTMYAVRDDSTWTTSHGIVTLTNTTPINTPASTGQPPSLVQAAFDTTTVTDAGFTYTGETTIAVDYVGNPSATIPVPPKRGCYVNFPLAGERMLQNIVLAGGQRIKVFSTVPNSGTNSTVETCTPQSSSPRTFENYFNIFTCSPPARATFDTALSATVALRLNRVETNGETLELDSATKVKIVSTTSANCPPNQRCDYGRNKYGMVGVRANWRSVQ